MRSLRLLFFTIIINQLSIINCSAAITINSVQVTTSTCPNNGTATIYATSTSDSAVFLYNIVSGPVLYPLQNDSIFKSLYPGTYTAWVHDVNSYDSTKTTFTITGTYQQLAFTPAPVAPLCGGGYNSQIIANPNGTGLAPYTWQITSPYTGTPQDNDTLSNLASGIYVVKVTDACDNVVTKGAVIDSGGSGFTYGGQYMNFIGCDTAQLFQGFYLSDEFASLPLKLTIATSTDTVVKYKMPVSLGFGQYHIIDTLYHVGFGRYLSICITDPCNIVYCYPSDTINPFRFQWFFYSINNNCIAGTDADIEFLHNSNYIYVDPFSLPLTFTLTDSVSHTVVDSFGFTDTCTSNCSFIPPQTGGESYLFTVKDNCGDIFQQTLQWPSTLPAAFHTGPIGGGCIDSTGILEFYWYGFGSNLTIQLLSGPTSAHSTKLGFEYSDTIIYPIIYTDVPNEYESYFLGDMPLGTYTYQAYDSCGNIFSGSFVIDVVCSLAADYTVLRNCGGLNDISLFIGNGITFYYMYLYGQQNNYSRTNENDGYDSIVKFAALSPEVYTLHTYFPSASDPTFATLPGLPSCWSRTDTINIPPINDSILKATDVATCNGVIYIHIDADTFNGVLPFKYEIISGAETFAPQYSNLFMVSTYGTYVVGVVDSCGNVDARQISVDTGRFNPVVKSGGYCPGSKAKLSEVSSPFFTYRWLKPNGTIYTGNTLLIDPFTEADTGVYHITKTVNINGCTDSAFGSYYLVFKDTFQQNVSFCLGDTLQVGPYWHTATGTYADTLSGVYGCDSIVVSTLSLLPSPLDSIASDKSGLCTDDSARIYSLISFSAYKWNDGETASSIYTKKTGSYYVAVTDSNGCKSVSNTVEISVFPNPVDSIMSDKSVFCDSVNARICCTKASNTYLWNTGDSTLCINALHAGTYYVTISDNNGCSAVSNQVTLSVFPLPADTIAGNKNPICANDSARLCSLESFSSYAWNTTETTGCIEVSQAGDYYVTVTDANGCTAVSNRVAVYVYPVPSVSVVVQGDTLSSYGQVHYQWLLNDTAIANATGTIYIARQPGSYTLEVTDSNGCTTISNPVVLTGISDLVEESVSIYPNPSAGSWQLTVGNRLMGSALEVFDEEGRLIMKDEVRNTKYEIAAGTMMSGVYYLRISNDKVSVIRKLVKM